MPSAANVVVGFILGIVYLLTLVLGSMALVIGFQQIREAVRIAWQGPTAASDVDPGGWAMVRGTVHPTGAPVTGPLSGRESACVACRIEGLRKLLWISSWVTEHETVVGTRFEVTDGTGTTHVEPVGADISVDDDRTVHERPGESGEASDDFVSLFDDLKDVPTGSNVRYTEAAVQPGDEVVVYGPVTAPDGVPTFDGDDGITIATSPLRELAASLVLSAAGLATLGLVLLSIPGLFVVFFLIPRLLGL